MGDDNFENDASEGALSALMGDPSRESGQPQIAPLADVSSVKKTVVYQEPNLASSAEDFYGGYNNNNTNKSIKYNNSNIAVASISNKVSKVVDPRADMG